MDKLFSYHPNPSQDMKTRQAVLEDAFNAAVAAIHEQVVDPRYKAIAISELEKAGAMAVKGVFKNSDGTFRA